MITQGPRDHKIEPEHLGPLQDRPLAETAKSGTPGDLFPGASAFLSGRQQKLRREQWNAARQLARRLLGPEEHILYVAAGMEVPPVMHMLALGAMALPYHQVVLVFTDTRLIEVLMEVRGKKVGTRLRSYPWSGVREMKVSFNTLKLAPSQGKKQAWKVPVGGDRKLLKLLIPRLTPHLLKEGAARAEKLPLWHCPQCSATVEPHPLSCRSCRASFRSPRLAAILSLAFPGAGLFYAGHPFLATMDFLGEVILYSLFLMMVLQAQPGALAVVLGLGAFLFVMTKLESIHLSQILTARSKPETDARRTGFKRFAMVGSLMSLLLIVGVLPMAGAARPVLDRDLDASGEGSAWEGSRNAGDWGVFASDTSARSQWHHPSGLRVTLFAYPNGAFGSIEEFRTQFRANLMQQGVTLVKDDENLPAPFHGFRFIGVSKNKEGKPVSLMHYFVVDEQNKDLHQAVAAVMQENAEVAEELVGDFLSHGHWITATQPVRTASVAK